MAKKESLVKRSEIVAEIRRYFTEGYHQMKDPAFVGGNIDLLYRYTDDMLKRTEKRIINAEHGNVPENK